MYVDDSVEYLNDKHETAGRSIETKRLYTVGTTSDTKSFYFSRIIDNVHYASIYNDSTPMQVNEAHFVDGIEDVKGANHISRGEAFSDGRKYDEGVNHMKDYAVKDHMWYLNSL